MTTFEITIHLSSELCDDAFVELLTTAFVRELSCCRSVVVKAANVKIHSDRNLIDHVTHLSTSMIGTPLDQRS